jgi:hypothetical protein
MHVFLAILIGFCISYRVHNVKMRRDIMREAIDEFVHDGFVYDRRWSLGTKHYEGRRTYMESPIITFLRVWDWGYAHIVPEIIFDEIKPYIESRYRSQNINGRD